MGFALGTGYAPIEVQRYGEAEPRLVSCFVSYHDAFSLSGSQPDNVGGEQPVLALDIESACEIRSLLHLLVH